MNDRDRAADIGPELFRVTGATYASMGRRAAAFVLDLSAVFLIVTTLGFGLEKAGFTIGPALETSIRFGAWSGYMISWNLLRRTTPGKYALGLRLGNQENPEQSPDMWSILRRETWGRWGALGSLGLTHLIGVTKPTNQAWSDRYASTVVLWEPRPLGAGRQRLLAAAFAAMAVADAGILAADIRERWNLAVYKVEMDGATRAVDAAQTRIDERLDRISRDPDKAIEELKAVLADLDILERQERRRRMIVQEGLRLGYFNPDGQAHEAKLALLFPLSDERCRKLREYATIAVSGEDEDGSRMSRSTQELNEVEKRLANKIRELGLDSQ